MAEAEPVRRRPDRRRRSQNPGGWRQPLNRSGPRASTSRRARRPGSSPANGRLRLADGAGRRGSRPNRPAGRAACPSAGHRCHPGPDMDPQPLQISATPLHLSRVQPAPEVEAQVLGSLSDCHGATNGSGRSLECCQEPVAGHGHLAAAETADLAAHERMVVGQEPTPPRVSQSSGTFGRAYDVGEEDGRQCRSLVHAGSRECGNDATILPFRRVRLRVV